MLPCPSKFLFDLECMGCGGQRALLLLIQGEFGGAFRMYPPIYTVLLWTFFFFHHKTQPTNTTKLRLTILTVVNGIVIPTSYILKHFL